MRVLVPGAVLLLATIAVAAAPAQQPPIKDDRLFQSGIEITSVTATVTDHDGHLVTGLDREAFEVFEDGVRQNVTQFTRERVPVGLGVLLDNSDSMFGRRIQDARAAVNRFLFELLEPVDEFFLMAFNHKPKPLTGWTRAQPDVQRALDGLQAERRHRDLRHHRRGAADARRAHQAARRAGRHLRRRRHGQQHRPARAALGAAAHRRLRLRDRDRPAGAPGDQHPRQRAGAARDHRRRPAAAPRSSRTPSELLEATARIAEELNSQYVLGYSSPRGADGQYHSIRVRVAGTDYRVRARSGYVATPLARRRPSIE